MGTKTEQTNNIIPIGTETVHKICSGQVVVSLAVAVKELVENSLDAGATNIDIRFKNYGIDMIEVSDNGTGVTEDNFAALTLKYHTSKLNEYSDLLGVSSFGFRGEALSSLCSLANLIITTRHKANEYATKIEYNHKGIIIKQTPCSRQIGTTVSLTNLFSSLPVRQKEFHKNAKREFNKMTQLLYAYCLISVGVKITCSNQTSSNSKSVVVSTQGSSYKDNIASVFGIKQLQTLLEIKPEYVTNIKENIFKGLSGELQEIDESVDIEDVEIDLSEDSNDADKSDAKSNDITGSQKSQGYKNVPKPIEFTGFISSCAHGSGRSTTDRQFYFVNSRPCEPTKIMKIINEIYRQYNSNQYPFVFLNVDLDRSAVDVNVTPDKRKIFLTREKIILDILKNSLLKLFESIPRTLKVESSQSFSNIETNDVKPDLNQPRVFNSFLEQFQSKTKQLSTVNNKSKDKNAASKIDLKRKSATLFDFISSKTKKTEIKKECSESDQEKEDLEVDQEKADSEIDQEKADLDVDQDKENSEETMNKSLDILDSDSEEMDNQSSLNPSMSSESLQSNATDKISDSTPPANVMYLDFAENVPTTQIRDLADVVIEKSHTTNCKTKATKTKTNPSSGIQEKTPKKMKIITDKEDLGKNNRKSVTFKTSLDHVKALANMYITNKKETVPTKVKFKSEINPVFNKNCEEELSKEISKDSFKQMKVIGQFNLGFIITQLEDDLFIIDQHATDEIYNFETLQKTTDLTSQNPQQLELTGVNEQILMDNLAVFKKNGFTFDINEDALPTKRVKLLTLPMSKNWVFGKEDIEELLFMLRESPSEYCRPSRVRAMFASRACRKSVMIGTALSKADMKKLVDHMAEIDKPWNCPHGRPTIRHLVNLAMVQTKNSFDT